MKKETKQPKIHQKRLKELEQLRLSSEFNPENIFKHTPTDILVQIARGYFKIKKLSKLELKQRGLNKRGEWIGYEKGYDRER